MKIYIDESGSINNKLHGKDDFVIAMVHVKKEKELSTAYKRFVSKNLPKLKQLDQTIINPATNKVIKHGGKMFQNGKFSELKGNQFDHSLKVEFVNFFAQKDYFDLYIIRLRNHYSKDNLCAVTARGFNYLVKIALIYFFKKGFLSNGEYYLLCDNRNVNPKAQYFLQEYLNTELCLENQIESKFHVTYGDSKKNKFIQIADVFANLYYSHLITGSYDQEISLLLNSERLKCIFTFPPIAKNKSSKRKYRRK